MNDLTFGNEFTDTNDDRWRYLGSVAGGRYAFFSLEDTDSFDTDGVLKIKDISGFKLTGITAECLAEMATAHEEDFEFDYHMYGKAPNVQWRILVRPTDKFYRQERPDETPPQFFLRVAKERGYLK